MDGKSSNLIAKLDGTSAAHLLVDAVARFASSRYNGVYQQLLWVFSDRLSRSVH